MEYNKIIAVTGLPGLYELLSSKSDGAIVRSLDDKTTRFVASRVHNFSHLESIEVYTVRDNVNLVDILKAMEASSEKLPDEKDGSALKAYFSKVYPDLDFDRVYSSDLKKMVKWFGVLQSNNIEIKLSEPQETEEEVAGPAEPGPKKTAREVAKETAGETEEKPAPAKKKAAAKEAGPKAEKETVKEKAPAKKTAKEEEEKPKAAAKKAPAKKKEDSAEEKSKKTTSPGKTTKNKKSE